MKKPQIPANSFVKHIVTNYRTAVCFSPHLDDAVFSAGGLMAQLSNNMSICVVNVFTSAGDGRSTLSAKQFLKQSAVSSPEKLFEIRQREDKNSLSLINAQVLDLNYTDALWRKRERTLFPLKLASAVLPEAESLYPTYRYHIIKGHVHKQDQQLITELARRFRNIVPDPTTVAVFAPVGMGTHVDHCVVRDACRLAFGRDLFYWLDFPYFQRKGATNPFAETVKLTGYTVSVDEPTKRAMCERYSSQYHIVISDKKVLKSSEQFFRENRS